MIHRDHTLSWQMRSIVSALSLSEPKSITWRKDCSRCKTTTCRCVEAVIINMEAAAGRTAATFRFNNVRKNSIV